MQSSRIKCKDKIIAYFQKIKAKCGSDGVPLKPSDLTIYYTHIKDSTKLDVDNYAAFKNTDEDLLVKYNTLNDIEKEFSISHFSPRVKIGSPYTKITAKSLKNCEETVITHNQGEVMFLFFNDEV